jgi:transketolase
MVPTIVGKDFDLKTCPRDSTRLAFGRAVLDIAETNPRVVFLTADGATATNTLEVFKRFPERAFNVGIAEQNLIGIAAGMATCGLLPVVGGYAPFLAFRSLEQIRNSLAYTKQNVTIGGIYSGISLATGGSTHHTTEDIATLRAVANMTLISPADGTEAYKATLAAVEHPGPTFLRLGARKPEPALYTDDYAFEIGKAVQLRQGNDVTIITTGPLAVHGVIASDMLEEEGIGARVLNMHTLKPLDEEAVVKAAEETSRIVTVEEHNVLGGLGSAVAEVVTHRCPVRLRRIGIEDIFASIGPMDELHKKYGLTHEGISEAVKAFLSS